MSEIELRAYDTLRDEYLSAGQVILAIQSGKNPAVIHYLDILKSPDSYKNRFIIERYTGLKDGDRKVFQGDIYKWCGLTFPITIDDFHGYRFMFGKDQLCRAFIIDGNYAGNIHEAPNV